MSAAIRVEGLSKQYRIGTRRESYETLGGVLASAFKFPFRRGSSHGNRSRSVWADETFWALKDINFELDRGEVMGVIGRNGAGKSTLLKVLSRITEPTRGTADIRGRVGSLLEVGTGFHPELTGRENIFLNGAILGMSRAQIRRKFDQIVDFAEVEKFISTPVKRYSSGMYLRLAFAVAAHLEPEILIIDEVLAVGDAAFQKKCLGKMRDVAQQRRTVLFVSHNMAAVRHLCTRGILLHGGKVICEGPIGKVVDAYMTGGSDAGSEEVFFPTRQDTQASFTRFCLLNEKGEKTTTFSSQEAITFEMEFVVRETLSDDHVFLLIDHADGLLVLKAADDDGRVRDVIRTPGRYVTQSRFPGRILNDGVYRYRAVLGKRRGKHHDAQTGSYFKIEDLNDYSHSSFGKRNGLLLFPLSWDEKQVESV